MDLVSGVVWILLGALFTVLAIFVRGPENEQRARALAGAFGVVCVAGGAVYLQVKKARIAQLTHLLLQRRSELRSAMLIERRARGNVIGYAIAVTDSSNRRYRMLVASEQDARAILAGIPS